ncbi:MAG: glycosyltransferase [Cyclobacteriaceae bacterium]
MLKNTRFTKLITVSEKLSKFLSEHAIDNSWLPAYVPPSQINFRALPHLPGKAYFLFSIWKLNKEKAQSVYNIELAFSLLAKIKTHYHMLFLIGTEKESDMNYLHDLLTRFEVTDSITIIYEHPLTDYLENCRFLLRTNNSDGYGVSLQEAMDLRVPAIASDVCIRPKGTILFKKGNLDDLFEKVQNVSKYWIESEVETPDYHIQLIDLYKKYLK